MKKSLLTSIILLSFFSNIYAAPTVNIIKENKITATPLTVVSPQVINNITISLTDSADSINAQTANTLKKLLEDKFPNRVSIKISNNSELYSKDEELEAVQLGTINIIIPNNQKVINNLGIKDLQLFELPFLFGSNNDYQKIVNGSPGKILLDNINKNKSIIALGYISNGIKNFVGFDNYQDIQKYQNKIIATNFLGINNNLFNSLGSKSIQLKNEEIINTLNAPQPKIDIGELTFEEMTNLNKAKLITETNHKYNTNLIIVNKKWFQSLPQDIQNFIVSSIPELTFKSLNLTTQKDNIIKQNLLNQGFIINTLSNEQAESFKKAAIPVHSFFLTNINKELLLETYKIIKEN